LPPVRRDRVVLITHKCFAGNLNLTSCYKLLSYQGTDFLSHNVKQSRDRAGEESSPGHEELS